MASRKYSSSTATMALPPRAFPSSGFKLIDPSERVEEERLPFYNPKDYYPMRIGMVLEDRYQVVAKLGYGTTSTVWLCHDLICVARKYWALKVHVDTLTQNQELQVYRHLAGVTVEHSGRDFIRQLNDSFVLDGPHGKHDVFVMEPLGMSLRTLQEQQQNRVFSETLVINALDQVLRGLDYLHDSNVIHTGGGGRCSQAFSEETSRGQHHLHIGSVHEGPAMPLQYRAPEVILNMQWGSPVDVWSVGLLAWDLLEGGSLFNVQDAAPTALNDAHHIAAMVAVLGPPPAEFLARSAETAKYWNKDGTWKGPVPIPGKRSLESLATNLAGDEGAAFVDFLESLLCWLPEDRLTPGQAYFYPWLRG
ncbi:protein kinase [Colletotrichum higginsianum]|uniref:non-specific serine/threonine protein kinase n=1 Tax=Colletotrichum higginsianum (strain IMI 349063) TaxID=759273 RepID=H1V0F2_COLHI|nr:protein kinase [Colletotrichum higginsianum]